MMDKDVKKIVYKKLLLMSKNFLKELKYSDEYLEVAHRMVDALSRKRNFEISNNDYSIHRYAVALVYNLLKFNFHLNEKNEIREFIEKYSVNYSTITKKARTLRVILDMTPFNKNWYTRSNKPEQLDFMLALNGFLVDARDLDEKLQEKLYQQGEIPYIYTEEMKKKDMEREEEEQKIRKEEEIKNEKELKENEKIEKEKFNKRNNIQSLFNK